jgi:hypothetical protein
MKQFSYLVVLAFLFACQSRVNPIHSKKYAELEKSVWLLGVWQKQSGKGILTESWRRLDDSTFVGRSFFVVNCDTLSSEKIRLEQRNGKLYYIPTVADQNEGKPIAFTQNSLTDSTVTFENPQHDFPQKIDYRFQKPDSLIAEVSAMVNGSQKSIVFRMGKTK